jgi:hypothetical protein
VVKWDACRVNLQCPDPGPAPAYKNFMMMRVVLAASAALLLGSIGAFMLFVPVLSIATVICITAGLMLMFGLGFQTGPQGMLSEQLVPIDPAADKI